MAVPVKLMYNNWFVRTVMNLSSTNTLLNIILICCKSSLLWQNYGSTRWSSSMTYIYLGNHILSPAVCVPGSRGVPESTVFYQGCHCPWGTLVFLQKSRFLIVTIVTQLQSIVFLLFNFTFFFSDLKFWTFNLILYLFIFSFSLYIIYNELS